MQSVLIHGRQPAIGSAEAESLFGDSLLKPLGSIGSYLDLPAKDIPFRRLGGSSKLCKVLTTLPTTDWRELEQYLLESTPHYAENTEGKLTIGISAYELKVRPDQLNATSLRLKKVLKAAGKSVRIIPNKETALNSAQVLYNQLDNGKNWELVFIRDGDKTVLAQTTNEQNIDGYAARDQARPARDARVGMLPPKLAQIIINLAVGSRWEIGDGKPFDPTVPKPSTTYQIPSTILDPFCGTGVILQEALLSGYTAYGTDLEPRMVEYSEKNLAWLQQQQDTSYPYTVEIGDATSYIWTPHPGTLASETYLGRPFSSTPTDEVLQKVVQDVDTIHRKFLKNVAKQTHRGFRMCIAIPAWKTKNGFKHLKTLDSLEELGYTRQSFAHARTDQLVYYREDQIVGRELVVLIRK